MVRVGNMGPPIMNLDREHPAGDGATKLSADRRRHRREVVYGGIVEIGGTSYPIKNWSERAVLIAPCGLACKPGDLMPLRLTLPMERKAIAFSCDGRVVRADAKSQEMVLLFAGLSSEDRESLKEHFAE